MIRSSDTSRGNRLFYSLKRPDGLWGPPNLLLDEKEWKGREVHHSSPSSAEVNTLRTGDADLRFYVTTVQGG